MHQPDTHPLRRVNSFSNNTRLFLLSTRALPKLTITKTIYNSIKPSNYIHYNKRSNKRIEGLWTKSTLINFTIKHIKNNGTMIIKLFLSTLRSDTLHSDTLRSDTPRSDTLHSDTLRSEFWHTQFWHSPFWHTPFWHTPFWHTPFWHTPFWHTPFWLFLTSIFSSEPIMHQSHKPTLHSCLKRTSTRLVSLESIFDFSEFIKQLSGNCMCKAYSWEARLGDRGTGDGKLM